MRFEYPTDIRFQSENAPKYLKGASNKTGFYPVGRMNTWHGGIHVEENSPIKAIADGVVIAYRVPTQYHQEIINGKTAQYSNAFVLIQHNYESPNGQQLVFYSLYNHLLCFNDMKGNKVPDIFKTTIYKVKHTARDSKKVQGVRIRKTPNGGEVLATAPVGATLKIKESDKNPETNKKSRWLVEYTTPKGTKVEGYVFALKDVVKGKKEKVHCFNHSTGKVLEAPDTDTDGDRGTSLNKKANAVAETIEIIPGATPIEIAPEDAGKNSGWVKVIKAGDKAVEGYCNFSALVKEPVPTLTASQLDCVENTCIKVKAGTIVGHAGANGFEKQEQYSGAHIEVFTPEELEPFLTNMQKDGQDKKHFVKLPKGTELKQAIPFCIPKNTPLQPTGKATKNYIEVKVAEIELLISNRHKQLPGAYNKPFYTFESSDTDRLTAFNKFAGNIAKQGDRVKYIEIIKDHEGDNTSIRRVRYLPTHAIKSFWIKKDNTHQLSVVSQMTPSEPAQKDTISYSWANEEAEEGKADDFGKQFFGTDTTDSDWAFTRNKYTALKSDISECFLFSPDNDENTKTEHPEIVNLKQTKTIKDKDNKTWYLLNFETLADNGLSINYTGLIKEEDCNNKFSAYNWNKFGFKQYQAGNEYIYDFNEQSDFFKQVCQLIDEDADGILEAWEFENKYKSHYTVHKLSHMVCQHHSEWAYAGSQLSQLMSQAENVLNEGIKLEEDPERKQQLETLKQERLQAFETKVKTLGFWSEIKVSDECIDLQIPKQEEKQEELQEEKEYTPPSILDNPNQGYSDHFASVDAANKQKAEMAKMEFEQTLEQQKRDKFKFPTDGMVWHFHPIAFVEQMRRMGTIYKWAHSEFGNLIAKKESNDNYNICNKTKGGLKIVRSVTVVELSIKEVQDKQKTRDIFAVGRYQLIPKTLDAAVDKLKLDTNKKLDEEMQDKIFEEYLIDIKRPQIMNYLSGNGTIEDAMYAAAKEWASIGVQKGKRISDKKITKGDKVTYEIRYAKGGESYYTGDGLNKAHISPDEIKSALEKSK